jgi:hypothetical protein
VARARFAFRPNQSQIKYQRAKRSVHKHHRPSTVDSAKTHRCQVMASRSRTREHYRSRSRSLHRTPHARDQYSRNSPVDRPRSQSRSRSPDSRDRYSRSTSPVQHNGRHRNQSRDRSRSRTPSRRSWSRDSRRSASPDDSPLRGSTKAGPNARQCSKQRHG